jgi:molybdopterin molybdotransferase
LPDSFLELIHLPEAVAALLESLGEIEPATEEVAAAEALGRVLAGDVTAPEDLPGFRRSTMDGYAVRASDTYGASEGLPAYLELVGVVPMGAPGDIAVGPGQAVSISTGGFLPDGADAVVMVENTELSGTTVEVVKGAAPGDNTVRPDEDIARGALLFAKGRVLGPSQIGALAGLGIPTVIVFKRPLVAILATGDELVPSGEKPGPGQVRDVNTAALCAAVAQAGGRARSYGIARDDFDELLATSRKALRECDALLISGGSSAGLRDLTVDVLRELGEPGVLAHGIYLKPGKPTLVAVCDGKPVLGLPGNPASALAVFRELMVPLLKHLGGEGHGPTSMVPRVVQAVIERSVSSATGRLELVPVSLRTVEGGLVAVPVLGKSSLIGTLARAQGQVRIPEGSEGLEAGQRVTVELLE